MSRLAIRLCFALAVSLVALAVADPLTEWTSNAGLFGRGVFTDHSNADVLPALLIGCGFVLVQLVLRGLAATRTCGRRRQAWLGAWQRALDAKSLARLLPCAFAMQICALFATETCEQFVVLGHGLGGTIWLGGPILASLTIHALVCTFALFAIARLVRAFAKTALHVASFILAVLSRGLRETGLVFRHFGYAPARLLRAPLVCRIGERAPPLATV